MGRGLRVTDSSAAELAVIARIGIERLKGVLDTLEKVDSPTVALSELRALINTALNSKDEAYTLSRQLVAMANYCRTWNEMPEDAYRDVLAGLGKRVAEEEMESLTDVSDVIVKLISDKSVRATSKALDLAYDYTNLYQFANIITDIRPVFDEQKVNIIGAVVSQTLRLRYQADRESKNMSLAMDNEDVAALRDACEDALKKAESTRQFMKKEDRLSVFIAGEESYSND